MELQLNPITDTELRFDQYKIRQVTVSDAVAFYTLVNSNHDRIARYFPFTAAASTSIENTAKLLEERVARAAKLDFVTYVIMDETTNALIGCIFIKDINRHVSKGELGFFIDKAYEGKGVISKTVEVVVSYCFDVMCLNKVYMRIAEENIPSRRVAEKNGFMVEGILRQDFRTDDDSLIDVVYYGLLNKRAKS